MRRKFLVWPKRGTGFSNHPLLAMALAIFNIFGAGFLGHMVWQGQNFGSSQNGATSAAPGMGYYLGNNCSAANIGKCFSSPANTQQCDGGSWTSGNSTITCGLTINSVSASVAANVATYTIFNTSALIPTTTWLPGQSVTIVAFLTNTFFNQTCTATSVTSTTIVCPLVHANASSSTGEAGMIINNNVGPFVPSDAGTGKRLFGYQTARGFQNLSTNNNLPITTSTPLTISSYVASNRVTLSGNAQNTVSSAGAIAWGNTDDAAAVLVDAAIQSDSTCQLLHLQAGNYMFTDPHFVKNPTACATKSSNMQAPINGNFFYPAGFGIEGRNPGSTDLFMTPGFPESSPGCVNGVSGKACWVVPVQGFMRNIRFTGLGNYNNSNPGQGPHWIEVNGPALAENIGCDNWGAGIGTGGGSLANDSIGLYATYWVQIQQVYISGCGSIGYAQQKGSFVNATRLSVENPRVWGISVGLDSLLPSGSTPPTSFFENYNLVCYECRGFAGQLSSNPATLVNTGGEWIKLYHSAFTNYFNLTSGTAGYACITTAGCLLDAEDTIFDFGINATQGTPVNNNIAMECLVDCTTVVKGVTLSASATGGTTYVDTAGSTFRNLGNTTVSGAAGLFTPAGKTFASPQESGTVTCSGSAATITFKATYLFNPLVVIQDQTTAGAVTQTSLSTTTKVVACPGATDVLLYTVTPNPV